MRRRFVVGNWKMNTQLDTALALARSTASEADLVQRVLDVGICPPTSWIVPVSEAIASSSLTVGAQDVSPDTDGAFTGDVSATMLKPWCSFVLIGHSERRSIHGETDDLVGRKIQASVAQALNVVLCVGETSAHRASGSAEDVVRAQVRHALRDVNFTDASALTIAYEPVWAIGSGQPATVADAEAMATAIRVWLSTEIPSIAERVRILYGGSISHGNVLDIVRANNVDGVLVGSASLDGEQFSAIIRLAANTD